MTAVRPIEVPPQSLLSRYVGSGAYVDCYAIEIRRVVTHAKFVESFYTTPLFKLERLLLGLFALRPSTDAQARQLALGERSSFAAWQVDTRAQNEILLVAGRTRSWLMVADPLQGNAGTRLMFGSAVVQARSPGSSSRGLGLTVTMMLPFHKIYSRALLRSAGRRLANGVA